MIRILERWLKQGSREDEKFEISCGGNPSALNIVILTENINATYFISFDIPLRVLHKRRMVNFAVASQKHVAASRQWQEIDDNFDADVVIMTRYGDSSGRGILDGFRRRGIPVIYHIDDDLLEIPESLGDEIGKRQGSKEVVETRRYILQNCDLIYASTQVLAELMQRRFPSQHVVYGIYAPYMGDMLTPSVTSSDHGQVIGYMGSKGHQRDLELVVPTLERLLREREELRFEVFGTIKVPDALKHFGSRVGNYSVQKSYAEFLASLASLGWSIGLAPLQDEPFNHCKAPTKFIEYTACGIAVVASRIPLYEEAMPRNGGLLVDGDWYTPLSYLLDHPLQRKNSVVAAQNHCAAKYDSEVLQRQILGIIGLVIKK